jgi:hypothetical protein
MFCFDPDSVLPRLFPNDVTHIQFRQWKRHAIEGLDISDNKRLPEALLKERARLHIVLIPHVEGYAYELHSVASLHNALDLHVSPIPANHSWRNQAFARFDRWSLSDMGMLRQPTA